MRSLVLCLYRCRSHKIWRSLRRCPLKAGPTPEGPMASICAPAVRSTCSTLHLSIVRKHAPPQPRATPTNFAPSPTDLLKLVVGHQVYDVIVISNPDIDAGHVNLTATRLHFPPPSPPHSLACLIGLGLSVPPNLLFPQFSSSISTSLSLKIWAVKPAKCHLPVEGTCLSPSQLQFHVRVCAQSSRLTKGESILLRYLEVRPRCSPPTLRW